MYESFFGFQSRPFAAAPNTNLYFAAGAIEHARQTLVRSIERADGVAVVVGPAGTGKSLLLSMLSEQFGEQFHIATLASARLCTRRALLQNILFELKLPYRNMEEGELRLSLIDHLEPETSAGMLLLVDEAHTLPMRLLEEIRMITNLVRDGEPRVRLVLAGTRSLEERLAHPKLDSLNQRVTARCFLEALSCDETRQFVARQIECVGGMPHEVFTDDALTAIHRATDGVPRLINQVADHALVLAGVGGVKPINGDGISEAWADLQQLPLPWNAANPPREETTIEFGSLEDDSPLADRLFEETAIEVEDFSPTIEEDDAQVELRVAPQTRPETLPANDVPAVDLIEDAIEELVSDSALDTADEIVAEDTAEPAASATDDVDRLVAIASIAPAPEADDAAAAEPTPEVAQFSSDTTLVLGAEADEPIDADPPTLSIDAPLPQLVGEKAYPLEVMDDPFEESFDAEEIVIESRDWEPGTRVKVDGGPLARELADLLEPADDEPAAAAPETQGWTIDIEAVEVEPIIEVAQADVLAGILGDGALLASEDLGQADLESASHSTEPLADHELADQELADREEWEPAYPAITDNESRAIAPEDEPRLTAGAEPSGELLLDDGDMIVLEDDDEPSRVGPPAPKARAVVRDYRRLFAQLRRG